MNALVLHNHFNNNGGAEKVAVSVLALLKRMGFKVTLMSHDKVDWRRVSSAFGCRVEEIKPEKEIQIGLLPDGAYKRLLESVYTVVSRKNYDLIISTYAEADRGLADINYIHYPHLYGLKEEREKVYRSSLWKLYHMPYQILHQTLDSLTLPKSTLIVNSTYTQKLAQRYIGFKPLVIHPPVDSVKISSITRAWNKGGLKRDNIVTTIGRIAPGKYLDAIPFIAAKTRSVKKFIIIGSTQHMFPDYLSHLHKTIHQLGLKDKIVILTDLPFEKKIKLMAMSRVYLHVMPNEHFGIAVVEAMAAGLVPVVHRSGGPWIDILQRRHEYGLSYSTLEDAAYAIDEILMAEEWFIDELSARAREAAIRFDEHIFNRKMRKLIELRLEDKYNN